MSEPLVKVRNLKIGATVYPPGEKPHDIEIVHGVSFDLQPGKVLGLIGESGAGKIHHRSGLFGLWPGWGQNHRW